jgi:hypothetical protein
MVHHQVHHEDNNSQEKSTCADSFCFTLLIAMHVTVTAFQEIGVVGQWAGTLLHISVTACAVQCTFGSN